MVNATLAKLNRLTSTPGASSDGALLTAFLAGDQGAFAALVHRHAGLVFSTCRRVLRHRQDAEDALQATFIVLARRAGDVWPREAVAAWLFGVAHRVSLKARAVRGRRAAREHALEDVAAPEPARPDADLADVVHRVVCRLPEIYRSAVVACDLQGLSRKEAAERLGWSEGTLSGRLARARELLATRLRRVGLALPAGGLVAACAATEGASAAAIQSTIDLAIGTGAGVSAPVAALTEGVVSSMALFKLKAMTAVVFAACALGFGAFAASGSGSGDGAGTQPGQKPGAPATTVSGVAGEPPATGAGQRGPRLSLAQEELRVLAEELKAAAGKRNVDPDVLARLQARIKEVGRLLDPGEAPAPADPPAKPGADLDPLQGSWRVTSVTDGNKKLNIEPGDPWVIEISGSTMKMPYRDATGAWKQRRYGISVEFARQKPDAVAHRNTIDLITPHEPTGRGIYEVTAPLNACMQCHKTNNNLRTLVTGRFPNENGVCEPALKNKTVMHAAGLRLALTVEGKRPTKFGGEGVIVFEMVRAGPKPTAADDERTRELRAQLDALAKKTGDERVSDLALAQLFALVENAQLDSQHAKLELAEATAQLQITKKAAELAEARWAGANQRWQLAVREYEDAKARAAKGTKAPVGAPGGAEPTGAVFTVHIRTLTASEKVIKVKATGNECVLDGLLHAIDDIPIMTGTVNVWLVRGKEVMPVELPAIKNGVTYTNYQLKPGDQLFVQVKAEK
ncbi:sigma-70 family RNA polymerase sigma factor [Gemmata sp. G18]|uniref:Sigma-70 family RNA polymerase sigma factor n=1 Tax=Gemmata palustris TaxID=2822762 RepID=A0ABS5BSX3_9BACT|nr:sigma-70 family RNA polymerase sigma factor [Gemmata palustris]MBP3956811.1 sigma-70 family RNA polymerase sigma factor [Gemmata palustris]